MLLVLHLFRKEKKEMLMWVDYTTSGMGGELGVRQRS